MTIDTIAAHPVARINGVALNAPDESPSPDELRQRACTEMLRQAAQSAGLLAASDAPCADGVISEAASVAIEALLEQNLKVPEPSEEACRRHHGAHASTYRTGERVRVRHILFAVTPGVDVAPYAAPFRRGAHDGNPPTLCADRRGSPQLYPVNCPAGDTRRRAADQGRVARRSAPASCSAPGRGGRAAAPPLPALRPACVGSGGGAEPGRGAVLRIVRGAVGMALRTAGFVTALRAST